MFKKIGLVVLAVMTLMAVPASSAQAASLIASEKHYYTVQLRSDKRTLNYAKIIFENTNTDEELSNYVFSLPKGVSAKDLSVQQILAKRTNTEANIPCRVYETFDAWKSRVNYSVSGSTADKYLQATYEDSKRCLEYEQVSDDVLYDENFDYDTNVASGVAYYDFSYYTKPDKNFDYSDLKFENTNGEYAVTLSRPIKPGKQTALLVSYIAEGVVSGGLGRYDYNYRTLVSKEMISSATVAINFDEGLFSRDAQQKRVAETSQSDGTLDGSSAGRSNAAASYAIDDIQLGVGQGGVYTKTQTNLLPGDVMSVKGVFAEKPSLLFLKEIVTGVLVITALIAGSIFGHRLYRKKHPKKTPQLNQPIDTAELKADGGQAILPALSTLRLVWISVLSFVAALVGAAAWFLVLAGFMNVFDSTLGILPSIAIASLLLVLVLLALLLPLAYMLRYGALVAFKWACIHLAVCTIAGVMFMMLGLMLSVAVSR